MTKPFRAFTILSRVAFTAFNVVFTMKRTACAFQESVGLALQHLAHRSRIAMLNTLGVSVSYDKLQQMCQSLVVESQPDVVLAKNDPLNVVSFAMDNHDANMVYEGFRPSNLGARGGLHATVSLCYVLPDTTSLSALFELLGQLCRDVQTCEPGPCSVDKAIERFQSCGFAPAGWELTGAEASAIEAVSAGIATRQASDLVLEVLRRAQEALKPSFNQRPLLPAPPWLDQSRAFERLKEAKLKHTVAWLVALQDGTTPPLWKDEIVNTFEPALPSAVTKIALRPLMQSPTNLEAVAQGLQQVHKELSGFFNSPNVNITVSADEAVMKHVMRLASDSPAEYGWISSLMGVLHLRMNASAIILNRLEPVGLSNVMSAAGYSPEQVKKAKLGLLDFDRRDALLTQLIDGVWLALCSLAAVTGDEGMSPPLPSRCFFTHVR
jgi:hypothetical protein